jgi:hypothetical protein
MKNKDGNVQDLIKLTSPTCLEGLRKIRSISLSSRCPWRDLNGASRKCQSAHLPLHQPALVSDVNKDTDRQSAPKA